MSQALYPRRRRPDPEYFGGPQRLSGRVGGKKRKNFLALPGFEPRLLGCSARNSSHYADYTVSFPTSAKETCRNKVLSNHNAAGFTLTNAVLQFNLCYSNEVNRGRDKSCM